MRITTIAAKVKNGTGMLRGPEITGWISRACPTCEARPGNPCYRMTGGKVRGISDGGYPVKMKGPHRLRRMSPDRSVEA